MLLLHGQDDRGKVVGVGRRQVLVHDLQAVLFYFVGKPRYGTPFVQIFAAENSEGLYPTFLGVELGHPFVFPLRRGQAGGTPRVGAFKQHRVVGLAHEERHLMCHRGLQRSIGEEAGKGADKDVDLVYRGQSFIEFSGRGRIALIVVDDKADG